MKLTKHGGSIQLLAAACRFTPLATAQRPAKRADRMLPQERQVGILHLLRRQLPAELPVKVFLAESFSHF